MQKEPWLIVANPVDAERIAAHHVKKAGCDNQRVRERAQTPARPCPLRTRARASDVYNTSRGRLYQGSFLGEGVLSQIHVDEWKAQRHHLLMGVLPMASLSQTFDILSSR